MKFRKFIVKIVADNQPNSEGYWADYIVPDVWPGDDLAEANMLRDVPNYCFIPYVGAHVVSISEFKEIPKHQPGTMYETLRESIAESIRQFKQG